MTLPQSLPGIIAGSLLVFIPAVGEYVIPTLLGRTDQLMIGRVLSDEFFENRDWPVASAVAILILLLLVVPIMLFQRAQRRRAGGRTVKSRGLFARTALIVGLIFLYVPIISMIVFSFNNSRLVTVWDAAHSPTLKWYGELLHNGQILAAAWLSIRIALVAATGAVILGTLAGMALARFGTFRGRTAARRHDHRADRHAGGHHRPVAAAAVRGAAAADRLAQGASARSRSRSRTLPSAWPT